MPTVVHLHGGHTPAEQRRLSDRPGAARRRLATAARGAPRRSAGDVSRGRARLPLSERPARGDALVPRPPDGLHRPAGLARAGRASTWSRDDVEDALPLPRGDRDVPLMIMRPRVRRRRRASAIPSLDRRLAERRRASTRTYVAGVLGDVDPGQRRALAGAGGRRGALPAPVLNASNARRYQLGSTRRRRPGRRSSRSAPTAGCWPRRSTHDARSTIAPAERFDVVVDFAAYPVGTEVTADQRARHRRHRRGDAVPGRPRRPRTTAAIPARWPRSSRWCPAAGAPRAGVAVRPRDRRRHRRTGRSTASRSTPTRSTPTSAARARSRSGASHSDLHHPVHVHLSPVPGAGRAARRGPAASTPAGRTPSTCGRPSTPTSPSASPTTPGVPVHCHNLEHEDMMMMAAFETVA